MYLNDFAEEGRESLKQEFKIGEKELQGVEILLASYGYECYEGEAFVLFKKDGKLWEVNGSHCSCFGLEDQWEPEETTVEALSHRLVEGRLGTAGLYGNGANQFADELRQVLKEIA